MWHLTRRTLLAGAAVLAGDAALAQSAPPARVKGPLVWLDLDQKELDDAYDQSVYAPNQRADHRPLRDQQRAGARAHRRAQAAGLRLDTDRRRSISTPPRRRTRRSRCSSTAAPGARASPRTTPLPPRCSWTPARISSSSTSTMSIETNGDLMPMARAGAPCRRLGLQERGELRRRSRTASTSPVIPPAVISRAWCSPPTGRRTSACRATC